MVSRKHLVEAARGDKDLDIQITGVKLVNVLTGTIDEVDIGILGNRISVVVPAGAFTYSARQAINGKGLFAAPGFIDGHVHNESSMVTPARWAEVIIPLGTTTVCTDPHEIGNVLGLEGIRYMLDASKGLPFRYYVTASSCIPAVPSIETAGATFTDREIAELLSWERVIAIAEAMDYMGLINQTGNITPIVEEGHRFGVPIEGHAPGVTGKNLQAYLAACGPSASDHESIEWNEMLEKVTAGMMVYARASTFSDRTAEVAEAMRKVKDHRLFGFCTDDILPHDLLRLGHLDHGLRRIMANDVDPITAIQMATINMAQHYGLNGLGAVAPGWLADIVLLDDLREVSVVHVIVDGQVIVSEGRLAAKIDEPVPPLANNTVQIPELSKESFILKTNGRGNVQVNAIDMSSRYTSLTTIEVTCTAGHIAYPLDEKVAIAAIVPRHGQNTAPNLAPIWGYSIHSGAIASTISHDSHNLAVIGKNPRDMLVACRELGKLGGGLVAVKDGDIIASVPLPIAGLMSPLPVRELAEQVTSFEISLPKLGIPAGTPMPLLAMALPVIPEVRITDQGMVNVATQEFIPVLT